MNEKSPAAAETASEAVVRTGKTPAQIAAQSQLLRDNVPAIVKSWPVWVNETNKVPLSPVNGGKIDPTDISQCGTFEQAIGNLHLCDGASICLFKQYNLTIIDIDATDDPEVQKAQQAIIDQFPSYSERSRSRTGRHIFVGGYIGAGCRVKGIEVYSEARHMVTTGDAINNLPIIDGQAKLDILVSQMRQRKAQVEMESRPQTKTDEQVIAEMSTAANASKALRLHYGNWTGDYHSQSEADQAYVNILAYYSDNKEQVVRLFRSSTLAANLKNGKPRRDNVGYVNRTVDKAFDQKVKLVDTSALLAAFTPIGTTVTPAMPTSVTVAQVAKPKWINASELQYKVFLPTPWVVPTILPQGLAILGGRPKLGKSWLALSWAMAVADGGWTLGLKCEAGDVLYAALEDTERRLKVRLGKTLGSSPFPKRLTLMTEMPRAEEGGLVLVREWIEQASNPRLVIVDTLAMVRSGKGKTESSYDADYRAVSGWKALADEFNLAVILVHHVRKQEAEDPLEMISGTNGLTGSADSILILNRTGQGCSLVGRGRDLEEFALGIRFDPEHCVWANLGNLNDAQRSTERSTILKVLNTCTEAMQPKDIAIATGASGEAVRQLLVKMVETGEVEKTGRGLYITPRHNGHNVTNIHLSTPHHNGNNDTSGLL